MEAIATHRNLHPNSRKWYSGRYEAERIKMVLLNLKKEHQEVTKSTKEPDFRCRAHRMLALL